MFVFSWVPSPLEGKSNEGVCSSYKLDLVCIKIACFVQSGHGSCMYKTFAFSVRVLCKWTCFVQSTDILCTKFWTQKEEIGRLILIPKPLYKLDHELLCISVPSWWWHKGLLIAKLGYMHWRWKVYIWFIPPNSLHALVVSLAKLSIWNVNFLFSEVGKQAKLCRLLGCLVLPIKFVISWQSKPRFKNTSKSSDPFAGVDIISPSPPASSYALCMRCMCRYSVCVESTLSWRALKIRLELTGKTDFYYVLSWNLFKQCQCFVFKPIEAVKF